MQLSQEHIDEILYEYKRLRGSPFKVSKSTGFDVSVVWEVIDRHGARLNDRQERWGGEGRPEMRDFIVARRRVTDREWNNKLPEIEKARGDYEAGSIELCTGRDGGWLILYAVPRKTLTPRPNYFLPEW